LSWANEASWGAYGGSMLPPFRGPRPPKAEAVRNRLTRAIAAVAGSAQRTRALAFGLLALATFVTAAARADGVVSARTAYYKEKSTLVVQPMVDAQLDAGDAGRVDLHVLVDSITSASTATGAQSGVAFTELRYEGGFAYSHAVTRTLRIGGITRYSVESDYNASYLAARAELELFDRNTTVAVLEGRGFDTITNGVEQMQGEIGTPRKEDKLRTGLTSVSVTQILTPALVGNVTYDFLDSHGYHANFYRRVQGAGFPAEERAPRLRLRHAVYGGVRGFIEPTRSTLVAGYRLYVDDWGIVSHTPEVRVIQEIVEGLDVRGRFRYYRQGSAEFYQDTYTAAQVNDPSAYITDDAKLSEHSTTTFGGQISLALGVFCVEGPWREARFDLVVERILQTTYFGDAWNAQLGFTLPVLY
jgi:hypothetical protein